MFRKSASLLVFVVVWVICLLLLQQHPRLSAAGNESGLAYIPLIFHNYPPPPPQRYFDDFSDPTRNWFVGADDVLEVGHIDGEYRIRVKADTTLVSVISPARFGVTDYMLDVDVRRVDGSDIAYGLVLDWLDWDHYAVLLVVPALERYALLRISDGDAEELIPWTVANGLNDGLNHIGVKRRGTYFSLFINGTVEVDARDLDYGNDGPTRAGLAVLAVGTAETTGGFDNFLLVELPQGGSAADELQEMEGASHHVERVGWRPR